MASATTNASVWWVMSDVGHGVVRHLGRLRSPHCCQAAVRLLECGRDRRGDPATVGDHMTGLAGPFTDRRGLIATLPRARSGVPARGGGGELANLAASVDVIFENVPQDPRVVRREVDVEYDPVESKRDRLVSFVARQVIDQLDLSYLRHRILLHVVEGLPVPG